MATWYVDPTATYNGDGTLPSQAAGAGQPGAWNALVAVMTNNTTYPLSGGDVVFIRSADTNGNDLVVNITTTFTMPGRGTDTAPVFWVLDNGTIWPYAGQLTMNISTEVAVNYADNSWLKAFNRKWKWLHNQGGSSFVGFVFGCSEYDSIVIATANNYTAPFQLAIGSERKNTRWIDCLFDLSQTYGTTGVLINLSNHHGLHEFIGCTFDLSDLPANILAVFSLFVYGAKLRIIGGEVINGNENSALVALINYSSGLIDVCVDGTDIGPLKPGVITAANPTSSISRVEFNFTNINNDRYRMRCQSFLGVVEWVPDENYPVLNAMLPDASMTPWSLKALPSTTLAGVGYPMTLSKLAKFYDLSPAVKQITAELLICNTYPTMRKCDWWAVITYVEDSTGKLRVISTFDLAGDLETSTADWSATVYGAKTYVKRKMEVTTPTAIRQYTDIVVEIKSAIMAPSITDFYFVDPEFTVA